MVLFFFFYFFLLVHFPVSCEVLSCMFFLSLPLLLLFCYSLFDFLEIYCPLNLLSRFGISVRRHLLSLSYAYWYSCRGGNVGFSSVTVIKALEFSVIG